MHNVLNVSNCLNESAQFGLESPTTMAWGHVESLILSKDHSSVPCECSVVQSQPLIIIREKNFISKSKVE